VVPTQIRIRSRKKNTRVIIGCVCVCVTRNVPPKFFSLFSCCNSKFEGAQSTLQFRWRAYTKTSTLHTLLGLSLPPCTLFRGTYLDNSGKWNAPLMHYGHTCARGWLRCRLFFFSFLSPNTQHLIYRCFENHAAMLIWAPARSS